MATLSVTRRYRFSAAHRLHCEDLSVEENRRIFGKCNNPNGHGHNYVLYVTVAAQEAGEGSGKAGAAIDALDRLVEERVVARFEHRDLNRDPAFAECTTTGENLVLLVWDLLAGLVPFGRLTKIGLVETRDNYFEYDGAAVSSQGGPVPAGQGARR
jgi:6-pyruvoyltetrahydropterin/6-carboxytetrahydropterin synthase